VHEQPRPDEAARALHEIRYQQHQVIRRAIIPAWYWWVLAGLTVGFSVALDSDQQLVLGIGTALFVIGALAAAYRVVIDGLRCTRLHSQLIGRIEVPALLGFVAAVVAVSLSTTYAFKAADLPYPATLGSVAGALLMVIGGPWLTRVLQRVMMAKTASGQG